MRELAVLFLAVAVTGCSATRAQPYLAPADIDAATVMLGPGTGTIKGSALLRTDGGGIVTCAGLNVYLIPGTPTASSEMRRIFGGDKGVVSRGGGTFTGGGTLIDAPQPNRQTVCNAQGFFTFANVRAGTWYLMTTIVWSFNDSNQGGTMLGTATVEDGKEVEIVLSR